MTAKFCPSLPPSLPPIQEQTLEGTVVVIAAVHAHFAEDCQLLFCVYVSLLHIDLVVSE